MILHFNLSIMPAMAHFGYVSYKEPWIHFKRLTDEYLLYFIKNGELCMEENGIRYTLKRGDFFLLQPGLIHSGFKKACCDYFYIHFKHPDICEINKSSDEILQDIDLNRSGYLAGNLISAVKNQIETCYIPKLYHVSNGNTLAYLLYMLEGAVEDYNRKDECYKSLASSKLIELIIRVSREYTDANPGKTKSSYPKAFIKCQVLLDYLNNEYHQKINSQDIQERFEANYAYLNRVFHRMTGHTIINYLNLVRVKKASELIENTDINFSEIGYLVGIDDAYYFSKIFKKYIGLSPTQYRKKVFIGKDLALK